MTIVGQRKAIRQNYESERMLAESVASEEEIDAYREVP